VLKIHLVKPLNDLKTLFWDMAVTITGNCELVQHADEADIVVTDNPHDIPDIFRHDADIVVIGAGPIVPERDNVFFISNHERIRWFIEMVPRRRKATCVT
jgi:hypothetical protein